MRKHRFWWRIENSQRCGGPHKLMRSTLLISFGLLISPFLTSLVAAQGDPCYSIIARHDKAQNTYRIDPSLDQLPGWRNVIERAVNNWNVRGTNFMLTEAVDSRNVITQTATNGNFFRGSSLMVTQIKTDPSYNVFIEEPTAIRVNMGIQWFLGVAIVLPSG